MSDPNDLGAGTVTVDGQETRWHRIQLLPNGVLRVAKLVRWDGRQVAGCAAEETVEYYAPGTWSRIRPEVRPNGTLVAHSEGYQPEVVGTCIAERQAIVAAAEYLIDNYADSTWHAERVDNYIGASAPKIELRSLHTDRQDRLHFEWLQPPR